VRRVFQFLRSLIFYILLGLAVVCLMPLVLVSLLMPPLARNRFLAGWSGFVTRMLTVVCGVGFEVEGAENIPEGNGIVLSKHQSAWETLALQIIFPAQTWVLKRELLWIPIFGWGLQAGGAIAIDRKAGKKALMQVIQEGQDRLDKGLWVVIFPEGTRKMPGEKGKYNPGGAMLAARSGYPVVPVAHNAGSFWNGKRFVIRSGTIRVAVGPAIETAGRKTGEINEETEAWIEARMAEMPR
jgi:1-acyl-sn-glycerol-3-phosphate acyltransferase